MSPALTLADAARLGAKALRARARELQGFARRYRSGRTDPETVRAYRQYSQLHRAARLLEYLATQPLPEPTPDQPETTP